MCLCRVEEDKGSSDSRRSKWRESMRIIRIIIIAEKVDLISSQDRDDDDEKEGTGNSLCTREVGDEREVQEENNHNKGINT